MIFQFSYNCFHIDLIKVQILKPVTLYTRILIIFVAIAWFSELKNIEDKMKHWFGILKPKIHGQKAYFVGKKIKVVHRKNNSWPRNKTKITKNSPWPQYKSHSHKNKIRGHKINVVSTKYISFHEFHIFM